MSFLLSIVQISLTTALLAGILMYVQDPSNALASDVWFLPFVASLVWLSFREGR